MGHISNIKLTLITWCNIGDGCCGNREAALPEPPPAVVLLVSVRLMLPQSVGRLAKWWKTCRFRMMLCSLWMINDLIAR